MPPKTKSHCRACKKKDTKQMVSCCHCHSWWHFGCVDVTQSIADDDRTFTCPDCQRPSPWVPADATPAPSEKGSKVSSVAGSTASTRAARMAKMQLEKLEAGRQLALKRLELENKRREAEMAAEMEMMRLQLEQTVMNESFRLRELIEQEKGVDDDNRSVRSEQSSNSKVQQWNARNSTMNNPAATATATEGGNNDAASKYSITYEALQQALAGISLNQAALEPTLGSVESENTVLQAADVLLGILSAKSIQTEANPSLLVPTGPAGGTQTPLDPAIPAQVAQIQPGANVGGLSTGNSAPNPTATLSNTPFLTVEGLLSSILGTPSLPTSVQQNPPIPAPGPGSLPAPPAPTQGLLPAPPAPASGLLPAPPVQRPGLVQPVGRPLQPIPQRVPGVTEPYCGPTPRQLASRHVVCKELPAFDGKPEEWPQFISAFRNSTDACGYSDSENLSRLQKSLKGHAKATVQSLLMIPAGVPHAIKQLEIMFGRPELLIRKLVKEIREIPAIKDKDNNKALVDFGVKVQNLCNYIHAAGQEAHMNNPELLMDLVQKLPGSVQIHWGMYSMQTSRTDVRVLAQFLQTIVQAAIPALDYSQPQQQPRTKEKGAKDTAKDKSFCGAHVTEESPKTPAQEKSTAIPSRPRKAACLVCESPKHRVKDCAEFATQKVDERWKVVKQFGICRACLGAHGKRPCLVSKPCEIDGCQQRHHSLLHEQTKPVEKAEQSSKNSDKQESKPASVAAGKQTPTDKASGSKAVTNHHSAGQMTLFRILPVTLHGNNRSLTVFAFLDDGSSRTLIDEEVVKQLGVVGDEQPLCLQWTANMRRTEAASQRVTLEIAGRAGGAKYKLKDVRTVAKLDLPRQTLRYAEMTKEHPYLKGLPIDDYEKAAPCILIGNDNAHVTATLKMRDGKPGEPIATKTRIGWTVYGSNQDGSKESVHSLNLHSCDCQDEQSLHNLVQQFFTVESLGVMEIPTTESVEVERAMQILQQTTKRVGQRFETGLLWKYDQFVLPNSLPMAKRRMQCLERRMEKDPRIGESVRRQISEYRQKGYIHRATEAELEEADPQRTWYLPLGVALNPKKPEKIRIFCDAKAKVEDVSLNSMLLKGPDLLMVLLAVLFAFRERQIAFCADLQEMFHQILIRKEDRHAQRLLWRDDPTQPPEIFLMDVATFGATCSPCVAQFVKNRNAQEFASEFPQAADAIISKHYVDDYLDSADSVEEAVELALQVKHVHSLGGFHLRSWLSNSKEFLARVGENDSADAKNLQLDKAESTERVLGMFWRPERDVFTFSSALASDVQHPTKRDALRIVMSPFDPAGLLCFFLVHGKILIQEMWRARIDWDERIPANLCERWRMWTDMFQYLDQISIPRCYFPGRSVKDILSLDLHIFVDASEDAYACVAYWRAVFADGVVVALVGGKSKVAPLKTLSIPRLELMAAVLGVRLMKFVLGNHSFKVNKQVLWSDSKTVLAWIRSDHRRYRQFVACAAGEITRKSDPRQWRWVPTKLNVADEATKWGKAPCLSSDGRWFKGPEFLYLSEAEWPAEEKPVVEETEEERRVCMVHQDVVVRGSVDWENFSKWTRLMRAVSYVHRFIRRVRQKGNKPSQKKLEEVRSALQSRKWSTLKFDPLEQEELELAETSIFRWIQHERYPEDVAALLKAREKQPGLQAKLDSNSPIRKASPYLDESGVIRSDGRIAAATCITFATKFPIILPKEHRVTSLICEWYHQKYLHANRETVVNEVRQRFHVSDLRQLVRKVAKRCQWCKVHKPELIVPREAPLPEDRLRDHCRPFTYVGIDYFGPLNVRVNRGTAKR